jgi:hypothetical protein
MKSKCSTFCKLEWQSLSFLNKLNGIVHSGCDSGSRKMFNSFSRTCRHEAYMALFSDEGYAKKDWHPEKAVCQELCKF